ncbi:DUF2510 domain-containing protein [Jatrophihabitans endophyticus]|uniref:DUF2510 domain-containing protein n=1 Tax=Jatrophihabitans endophyticus TaxID=1206085 RepID=UPI0019E8E96D|nr:DUF2510 domain-containing protein [Jatrophihabitans endophyticus]MBE7187081.1 DUF2510 domain-containing protein [Jatrophihabitans endophyticus]
MSEQYPQQQPGSVLEIRPTFFFLAFLLVFFKPYYSINRSPAVQAQWKQNHVPVPPGRYEVTVWVNYLFRPQLGINSVLVDVPPGSSAVVRWRAPLTIFTKGRIGVAGVGPLEGGSQQGQQQAIQPTYSQQPVQQQPVQQQQSASASGGWHPDPTGRHQVRYFDGSAWTEHVGDNGTQSRDPIG